jgi:hypothetical protein
MVAYLCYSVVLSGIIYPIVVHQIWSSNGFLSVNNRFNPVLNQGAIDFAGSGVVHLTGGVTALYATIILGPRHGRFFDAQGDPLENPVRFRGHSVALQLMGTMILWFGCKLLQINAKFCALYLSRAHHIWPNKGLDSILGLLYCYQLMKTVSLLPIQQWQLH